MATSASALERLINPTGGSIPPAVAEYLLTLEFPPEDHARYFDLSAKAQEGKLTAEEAVQLDDLLLANDVLAILQSKARASLKQGQSAA